MGFGMTNNAFVLFFYFFLSISLWCNELLCSAKNEIFYESKVFIALLIAARREIDLNIFRSK